MELIIIDQILLAYSVLYRLNWEDTVLAPHTFYSVRQSDNGPCTRSCWYFYPTLWCKMSFDVVRAHGCLCWTIARWFLGTYIVWTVLRVKDGAWVHTGRHWIPVMWLSVGEKNKGAKVERKDQGGFGTKRKVVFLQEDEQELSDPEVIF